MRSVMILAAAGAVSLLSSAAFAADIPVGPPPQYYAPPPVEDFGGWYLRGDIGMSNQSFRGAHQRFEDMPGVESFTYNGKVFDGAAFAGIGVGYEFNSWLRADITAEYRSSANMKLWSLGSAGTQDIYSGSMSNWVALANIYADLGTWWCLTPFVGAGIGLANNRIHDFYDLNPGTGGITGIADGTGSKTTMAWALHAGVSYKVTPNFTVELAYRYLNLGDAESGYFHNINPAFSVAPGPYQIKDITSHDIKLGVRWTCCDVTPPPPPPLITKG